MKIPEDKQKDLLIIAYKIELLRLQTNIQQLEKQYQRLLHNICEEFQKKIEDIEYLNLEEGIIKFKDETNGG